MGMGARDGIRVGVRVGDEDPAPVVFAEGALVVFIMERPSVEVAVDVAVVEVVSTTAISVEFVASIPVVGFTTMVALVLDTAVAKGFVAASGAWVAGTVDSVSAGAKLLPLAVALVAVAATCVVVVVEVMGDFVFAAEVAAVIIESLSGGFEAEEDVLVETVADDAVAAAVVEVALPMVGE